MDRERERGKSALRNSVYCWRNCADFSVRGGLVVFLLLVSANSDGEIPQWCEDVPLISA